MTLLRWLAQVSRYSEHEITDALITGDPNELRPAADGTWVKLADVQQACATQEMCLLAFLDSREFYELMQTYRQMSRADLQGIVDAFETVKAALSTILFAVASPPSVKG